MMKNPAVSQRKTKHVLFSMLLCVFLSLFFQTAQALELFNKPASKFLPVDQAFQTIPSQKNDTLLVDFIVTPQHYVYEQRIKLKLADGSEIIPKGYSTNPTFVDDPEFGRVAVFEQSTRATFTLPKQLPAQEAQLKWQGCATAGLCYPPVTKAVSLTAVSGSTITKTSAEQVVKSEELDSSVAQLRPEEQTAKVFSDAQQAHTKADTKKISQKNSQKKQQDEKKHGSKSQQTEPKSNLKPETESHFKPEPKLKKLKNEKPKFNESKAQSVADKPKSDKEKTDAATTIDANHLKQEKVAEFQPQALNEVALKSAPLADSPKLIEHEPQHEPSQQTKDTQSATHADLSQATELNNQAVVKNAGLAQGQNKAHSQKNSAVSETQTTNEAKKTQGLQNDATNHDPFGLSDNKVLGVLTLFFLGVGLAFTPCVLPMLPIVANIVANNHKHTQKNAMRHGFLLTLSYGTGVATAYGLLGVVVSLVGRQYIIHAMQNKWVLIGFALLFVFLALHLLGVVKMRMPSAISGFLHRLSQRGQSGSDLVKAGSYLGSAVAGFFSAIVVSPCVTAPLVGALAGVASVGEPMFGFIALFSLGFGLSVPLIILGTFEAKLLPEAGEWMNWVKHGFALLLFGVAILLLARVYHSSVILLLWGALTAAIAWWFWQWHYKGKHVTRALALGFGFWAMLQLLGAALGNTSPVRPLENLVNQSAGRGALATSAKVNLPQAVTKIYTLADLDAAKAKHDKLIVDVFADWCIECKIMDKNLFADPPPQMLGWQLIKFDITEANANSKAAIERLNLFGPPVLMFYKDGKMVAMHHGEMKRNEFKQVLNELN